MAASRALGAVADSAARTVWRLKQTYYHRLWQAVASRRWSEFERLMREMRSRNLHMDEVTYTLKAHQCILNPYKPNLSCYLVLEEMKQALVHPAVIRMNELLINSYFELEELKCQPPAQLWQNFAKATWQTSFRLTRQRVRKLREALSKMDPADVMRLSDEDVAALAQDEFLHAAFSATLAMDEIHDEPIEIGAADAVTAEDHEATMVGELPRAAGAAALSDGIAAEVDEFAFHSDADEAESDFDMEDEFENDIEHEFAYAHRHVRSRGRVSAASGEAS